MLYNKISELTQEDMDTNSLGPGHHDFNNVMYLMLFEM